MLGLMQTQPLLISSIITHAARHHPRAEIVSRLVDGRTHRTTYPRIETRARRLVRALQTLGVAPHDRVATLAWNSYRHLELYYAASGMGSVIHTVNPRLSPDDIVYILRDAGSLVLCADLSFVALLERIAPQIPEVRAVVLLADPAEMPEIALAPGQALFCYEQLLDAADDDYDWPLLDENLASSLCYTSGTTGRPKGVLYSHRSTLIHAYALSAADVFGLRAVDRVLPVVPMFHVNGWGVPYCAPLAGASLVLPGRHLDGPSLLQLLQDERVTFTAGVPTVWMGLLQHLRATGAKLDHLQRLVTGGSACPPMLAEAFETEYGVRVIHAWGMSETSPLGTIFAPLAGFDDLSAAEQARLKLKQGRTVPGLEMRIVDDQRHELPWDGASFGNLEVRGPWVLRRYFNAPEDSACPQGWFPTGDVATIDPDGYLEITDRTKDVVKSGGEWISSIQLENIAVSHPDVAEAAVVAARHPRWDERPLLVVVAKPGRTIDPAAPKAEPYERIARAVRRSILLLRHIAENPIQPKHDPAAAANVKLTLGRTRIARAIDADIDYAEGDSPRAQSLRDDLRERLEKPELELEILNGSTEEIIASIRRDLRLANSRYSRYSAPTPPRAAEPRPPQPLYLPAPSPPPDDSGTGHPVLVDAVRDG